METLRDDLIAKLGIQNLERIESVKVGIAGAGGLGSNCAHNLARVGFRKFKIVDFDKVAPSNLDRQFFFLDQVGKRKVDALKDNILRISPEVAIEAVNEKIEEGSIRRLFGDCDLVAECFDRAESKSMIVAELSRLGKFVVSVSGLGGYGSSDEIKVHRIRDNFILIGDLKSDIVFAPAFSPRVNIAAAKQADEILRAVVTLSYRK